MKRQSSVTECKRMGIGLMAKQYNVVDVEENGDQG